MSYGRVKIYSDAKEITIDNVVDEVGKAFALHSKNRIDTEKLWRYYRGDTDIQNKKKTSSFASRKRMFDFLYYTILFNTEELNAFTDRACAEADSCRIRRI